MVMPWQTVGFIIRWLLGMTSPVIYFFPSNNTRMNYPESDPQPVASCHNEPATIELWI